MIDPTQVADATLDATLACGGRCNNPTCIAVQQAFQAEKERRSRQQDEDKQQKAPVS